MYTYVPPLPFERPSHGPLFHPLVKLITELQAELAMLHSSFLLAICFTHHSVTQSCPTLFDPMDCSTPGFPVLHYLPEIAQTHVH